MKFVELVINVHNGEKYLTETIKSLINQDYTSIRIHCFDNCSTDNTKKIIKNFMLKHKNIIYYKTPNFMSIVEGRLFAISSLKSKYKNDFYFGFCDSDDLWEKSWVSCLMNFSHEGYDLLFCNGYILKNKTKISLNSCLALHRPSPFTCPVAIQSCLFSSKLILNNKPLFDCTFPRIWDLEFWIRRGKDLSYIHISNHLFYYRIHPDSAVQKNFFPILKERWRILRLHNLSLTRFVYDLIRQLLFIIFNSK